MRDQALWINDFLKFIGVNSVVNKLDSPNNIVPSRKDEVGRYLDIIFNTGEQRNFINFASCKFRFTGVRISLEPV